MISVRKIIAVILCFCLLLQCIPAIGISEGFVIYQENKIEEQLFSESLVNEEMITQEFILEHMTYEDELYEVRINEEIIVQAYTIELTVDVNTQTSMANMIPPQLDDYEIDWPSVIAKFAIGTAIIIVVGVVHYVTQGTSTFFIMATPGKVIKNAIVGGAIEAAVQVSINEIRQGGISSGAATKYAVEGFADGYMWGAIRSVLPVASKNIKRLKAFREATGKALRIKIDGTVIDTAGNIVGKAFYGKNQWYLLDAASKSTRIFDAAGKEILDFARVELPAPNVLPANSTFSLGAQGALKVCYTDSSGIVYRIGDELLPNITYKIGETIYRTDARGRIVEVIFDQLSRKGPRGRFPIVDSMSVIGKGYALPGDDKGHLIADMFDGNNTMANIVPMSQTVNRGTVKSIEMAWAQTLDTGGSVSGTINIAYESTSFRPSEFTYKYDIGNGLTEIFITNH